MFGIVRPCLATDFDTVVLDFLISLTLWNGVAENVDFGSANLRKLGFFARKIFMGHIRTPIKKR